ncbi:HSP20-like chaperone [Daedalea quercina L-15889]|uniref:HSP20-like chaperone n=1 Tax=Daedalea quercina L-15889 TaxID=1314783 RepID=A0A165UHY5_9APHY|nr:HSP20-like chaperone [Daedalea quercina L-15889]
MSSVSFPQFYYDPFAEFDRSFDEALNARNVGASQDQLRRRAGSRAWPRMDVRDNARTGVVEATFELPGMRKEDVNIDVHNNRLTVSGESKQLTERDESGYYIRERRLGNFSRTLQLPPGINSDEIKASMENGLLTVTFPRAAPEHGPKKIMVS